MCVVLSAQKDRAALFKKGGNEVRITTFNRHVYNRNRRVFGLLAVAGALALLGLLAESLPGPVERPFYEPGVVELAAIEGAHRFVSP